MSECIFMGGVACLTHDSAKRLEDETDRCDLARAEAAEKALAAAERKHHNQDTTWSLFYEQEKARAEAAEAGRDALKDAVERVREICAEAFPVYNTGQCVLVAPVLRALDGGE